MTIVLQLALQIHSAKEFTLLKAGHAEVKISND